MGLSLGLAKALFVRAYDEAQIQQLINFIDWFMVLDDRREAQFDATIQHYEEERSMPTLSRLEMRMEKRIEQRLEAEVTQRVHAKIAQEVRAEVAQEVRAEVTETGLLEARREDVLDNLANRFGSIPEDLVAAIQQITDQALLKRLHRSALQAATLEEFRALL